jgi:hypothetical protein
VCPKLVVRSTWFDLDFAFEKEPRKQQKIEKKMHVEHIRLEKAGAVRVGRVGWFVVFVSFHLLLNHVGVLVCDRDSHSLWHQERLSLGEGAKRREEPFVKSPRALG